MMNDRNVLITIAIIVIALMAGILYVTHQPNSQTSMVATTTTATTTQQASSTAQQPSTPTSSKPSVGTGSGSGSKPTGHPGTKAAPHITKFLPAAGSPGTTVTIIGTGFDKTTNHIFFGSSGSRYHLDKTPANQIETVGSPDGTTLTFTVPTSGPSGILCDASGCIAVSAVATTPGTYPVTVSNAGGTSNTVEYTVIKS